MVNGQIDMFVRNWCKLIASVGYVPRLWDVIKLVSRDI